jgi:hypothetical protein
MFRDSAMTLSSTRTPLALAGNRPIVPIGLRSPLAFWWLLWASISDRYRPERYYMRGRGPKWRAKHRGGWTGSSC